jgi:hypothetical protein
MVSRVVGKKKSKRESRRKNSELPKRKSEGKNKTTDQNN